MSTFKGLLLAGGMLLASTGLVMAADAAPTTYFVPGPLPWDAFGSVGVGQLELDTGSGSDTFARKSVRGSVANMLNPGFGLQVDVLGDLADDGSSTSLGKMDAAAHVYARRAGHLFGAFAQYRAIGAGSSPAITVLFVGGEAQWGMDRFQLYGQAAFQQASDPSASLSGSGWVGKVQGSFFVTENWRVDGKVGFDRFDASTGTVDGIFLGIGTEFRFNNPLSVFAQFEHIVGSSDGTPVSGSFFLVGAKWNAGTQRLIDRAWGGASLDPIEGIISVIR
jgi:hypothetical protein